MDELSKLIREHAELRRMAERVVRLIGPQRGVGWEDQCCCDLSALRAALGDFSCKLSAHEEKEERFIEGCRVPEMGPWIEESHASLNRLMVLLRATLAASDGVHMHSIRTVASRISDELDAHLVYEEKVLFPLLLASSRRRRQALR